VLPDRLLPLRLQLLLQDGATPGDGWLRALEDRRFANRGRFGLAHLKDGRGGGRDRPLLSSAT
ncbi:MAG: hypothetical protein ACYSUM_24725, partial [Planctomycetota bacterium]